MVEKNVILPFQGNTASSNRKCRLSIYCFVNSGFKPSHSVEISRKDYWFSSKVLSYLLLYPEMLPGCRGSLGNTGASGEACWGLNCFHS